MERLKTLIEQYSRWAPLREYIERIEGFKQTDFSISIENSKSLLESIAKEICKQRSQPLEGTESVGKLIGLSFGCLGYSSTDSIRQIGTTISNIGQQMGNFRNEVGKTSHGRTLDELKSKSSVVNSLTGDFLIFSTETVCSFLIEAFETDNPLAEGEKEIKYVDNNEFNEFWDDEFGDFNMAVYSFSASEILFNCDLNAYKTELSSYSNSDETNN
jgi:hypothetical protein